MTLGILKNPNRCKKLSPDLGIKEMSGYTHPMMRLSEYSFLLEKDSARLKKLRAGSAAAHPGMAAPSMGGTCVIRIPHDDRYLIA